MGFVLRVTVGVRVGVRVRTKVGIGWVWVPQDIMYDGVGDPRPPNRCRDTRGCPLLSPRPLGS